MKLLFSLAKTNVLVVDRLLGLGGIDVINLFFWQVFYCNWRL